MIFSDIFMCIEIYIPEGEIQQHKVLISEGDDKQYEHFVILLYCHERELQ